ncbi:hypothetical protein EYF80_019847 [Liparis tanakae]|uniref:Uncharacterized protein n=1 Tax=Liparis tanakae TaxID=230148 RepID=A0A4Z2HY77_9TELE|nr:hypothetical protein EYF80_019847 [Liparis tanakae]
MALRTRTAVALKDMKYLEYLPENVISFNQEASTMLAGNKWGNRRGLYSVPLDTAPVHLRPEAPWDSLNLQHRELLFPRRFKRLHRGGLSGGREPDPLATKRRFDAFIRSKHSSPSSSNRRALAVPVRQPVERSYDEFPAPLGFELAG